MRKLADFLTGKKPTQLTDSFFDYQVLDAETRIVVQQRTGEIRGLMKRTAQDIIEIGEKLIEVKERLGHGHFGDWLDGEFGWSPQQARRYMAVAEAFHGQNEQIERFAPSALYLLAAPSTPDEARAEAIGRAEAGEVISHSRAVEIVAEHKPAPAPPPATFESEAPAIANQWATEIETTSEAELAADLTEALKKGFGRWQETGPQPGEAEMMMTQGETYGEPTEAEPQSAGEARSTLSPMEPQAVESTVPAPDPQPPAPKAPLPPPVIGEAPWTLSITIRPNGGKLLISIWHGQEQRATLPADLAARVVEVVGEHTEAAVVEAEAEGEEVPEAEPEWLGASGLQTVRNGD